MDETRIGVLVAVGPDGIGDGALEVAAAEALRLAVGIELLHVAHSHAVTVPTRAEHERAVDQAHAAVGHEVLTDAARRLEALLDGQAPVSREIVHGPVARTIVERGDEARLIVLEAREVSPVGRLVTRSVSTSVAAHACTPVLVVPQAWTGSVGADLPITVGIDEPLDVKHDAPAALERARETGRPLVVLHAAWIAEPYQGVAFVGYPLQQWLDDAHRELSAALAGMTVPEDVVTCDVHWARPVDALVRATQRSSLLVLTRRPTTRPLAPHLGPVTRAVLHHTECPVLVVDREH